MDAVTNYCQEKLETLFMQSSGVTQCVLSSLGVMGRSATSTGHQVNSMRDGTRTGRYEG